MLGHFKAGALWRVAPRRCWALLSRPPQAASRGCRQSPRHRNERHGPSAPCGWEEPAGRGEWWQPVTGGSQNTSLAFDPTSFVFSSSFLLFSCSLRRYLRSAARRRDPMHDSGLLLEVHQEPRRCPDPVPATRGFPPPSSLLLLLWPNAFPRWRWTRSLLPPLGVLLGFGLVSA